MMCGRVHYLEGIKIELELKSTLGMITLRRWDVPTVKQVCRKGLRSMGWKRVLSRFYFCTSNPFGKLASQAKGQVKIIKTEQQWENLWCVIYLFVMKEMNPADSIWQWAAMIRQSVQITVRKRNYLTKMLHTWRYFYYANFTNISIQNIAKIVLWPIDARSSSVTLLSLVWKDY